jgi:hypothetical protein
MTERKPSEKLITSPVRISEQSTIGFVSLRSKTTLVSFFHERSKNEKIKGFDFFSKKFCYGILTLLDELLHATVIMITFIWIEVEKKGR